jgi:hypothetical protein
VAAQTAQVAQTQTAQVDGTQTQRAVIPIPDAQAASSGRKGGRANDTAKENDGAPKWALEAKATLENGTDKWGGGWAKLLGLWWALEKSTHFESSVSGGYVFQ